MFFELVAFSEQFPILNVFRYITFRSGGAVLTSLLICFMFGPTLIRWLRSKQKKGQPIRDDGPQSHLLTKKGTPTMGGLMMLLAIGVSTLLWADLRNAYIWAVLLVIFGFGLLGFVDDYLKVVSHKPKGVPGKVKLVWQFTLSILVCYWISTLAPAQLLTQNDAFERPLDTYLAVPFFKSILLDLGLFYFVFCAVVVVGASNAVNLTDGLDGLATVPVLIAAGCFGLIAYLVGNMLFSNYLQLHHVPGAGEIAVIVGAFIGSCLGFLWFNAPPAKVFMGDTGSLALGGGIGAMAVITKHEIVLAIIGGLFVMEALSVIIQVYYFKLTGKRVFLMAPIHHHFEKKGWSEPTVVIRFWILAIIFALIGLSTLKLR